MSTLDQSVQSRTQAFGEGAQGTMPAVHTMQQNLDPIFKPFSVEELQNIPSGNGYSAKDADRRLWGGGMRPTPNGQSQQTYQVSAPLQSTIMNV